MKRGLLAFAAGIAFLAAPASAVTATDALVERQITKQAFPPVEAALADRPAILLETGSYFHGPGTGNDAVELDVTLDNRGFDDAVEVYLYWQNRNNPNDQLFYNLPQGDFVNEEIDLFGTADSPVSILAPDLGTPGGAPFPLFGADGAFGAVPASVTTNTGLYQFVFELRRPNGSVVARSNAMYNWVDGVVGVSGTIGSQTWTSNNLYRLLDPVNVQSGATLTIQPGTVIIGDKGDQGTLVIRQNARIEAAGTAMAPIIFTSEFPVGQRAPGDWGGLVINGNAPTNEGVVPNGEGDSGPYGGNASNDDSGTLQYVRVEFAGIRFSDQNELNGIAFQGVGAATTVDHLQVLANADDCFEWFGGTVDAKYLFGLDCEDDTFDWVQGWGGKLQHIVAIQRKVNLNRLIEGDNLGSNPDAQPRSTVMAANGSFFDFTPPGEETEGIRLRRGMAGNFTHLVQQGSADEGIRVTEQETLDLLGDELKVRNSFFFGNGSLTDDPTVAAYLNAPAQNNRQADPRITNPNSIVQPDPTPRAGSPARGFGQLPVEFRNDAFFDNVNWAGGVNPADSWIDDGWTTFADN